MPNRQSAARRLIAALRPVVEDHLDTRGPQAVRATITYLHGETASRKFTAQMHNYDLVLSQENTTLSQSVIEYDEHTGLTVGDTLLCVEMKENDWIAVAVESDAQPAAAATTAELESLETKVAALEALGRWEPGDVKTTGRNAAPTGWLMCEGQEVSRTTYAALFTAIGTTYGAGNGTTTFNLPDGRGRTFIGSGTPAGAAGGTNHALGSKGGEETHTTVVAEMPAHAHGGATGLQNAAHHHNDQAPYTTAAGGVNNGSGIPPHNGVPSGGVWETATGNESANHAHAISAEGGGGAHNNLQPFVTGNWIIKT